MNTTHSVRCLLAAVCSMGTLSAALTASAQDSPPPAAEPAPAAVEPAPATVAEPAPPAAAEPAASATEPAPATQPVASEAALPPETPPADPAAGKPKPPPYSLPFQMRPVVAGTVLRSDTAIAFYENAAGNSGSTVASMLLGSYKVTDEFAPLLRLGLVSNSPPDPAMGAKTPASTEFLNPVVGATYALKLSPALRLGLFLGLTVPIGTGGGNDAKPKSTAAHAAGRSARSAFDNAMFAINDFTVFPGVGFAYVAHGFTAQVEATVFQLTRVRGEDLQKDKSRTNFTGGVHVGYFFVPFLSAAVELRHQRWLSTPLAVKNDTTETVRDTTTLEFGPRFHFKLGEKTWFRPAVGLSLPLDNPMSDAKYKIVHLDLPFAF